MKRFNALWGGIIFLLFLIILSSFSSKKLFIYNYTNSLPHGIYMFYPGLISKGDLIAFKPIGSIKNLIHERKYLRYDAYLMKYIVGVTGDSVCTKNGFFYVDGTNYGVIRLTDNEGKQLPRYYFCGRLKEGYIVTGKNGKGDSFDSRYYGPIKKENIVGKIVPVWLFGKEKVQLGKAGK